MKHLPFESIYRPDFEVVAQRQRDLTFYPHTEQLPLLQRALNLEFRGALPPRIARVDHRADDYYKLLLHFSAAMFCGIDNAARKDELCLMGLPDYNLVSRVTIVQQITEHHKLGACHRFRFYGGPDFFPEIYLSGRRVVFSDHVLQRFSARVPSPVGADLSQLLHAFLEGTVISVPVGRGRAFIVEHCDSILAFTYKEYSGEYFITTCLTINEMNSMDMEIPVLGMNFHYGPAFKRPRVRNWIPMATMRNVYQVWEKKTPIAPPPKCKEQSWYLTAARMRDFCEFAGYKPGSRICFMDNIPGPALMYYQAGQKEGQFDEEEGCRQTHPHLDWAEAFAERYGEPWPPPSREAVPVSQAA